MLEPSPTPEVGRREPPLLELTIRVQRPDLPGAGEREIVLRDDELRSAGEAWTAGGHHWVAITGVGTFQITPGSNQVVAFVEPTVKASAVEHVFSSSVLPIALHALHGYQSLHASAVLFERLGVVGFAAVSETGKSTIAAGLSTRGHPLWADDALLFDTRATTRSVVCVALPFTLRLKSGSTLSELRPMASERAGAHRTRTAELAALCLPERRTTPGDGGAAEIVRLSAADALTAVLPHAYFFALADVDRRRAMMNDYLELVSRVPVLRMRFDPGAERFPSLLASIELAVREHAS